MEKNEILSKLTEAVISGDENAVIETAENAVKAGIDPLLAITDGLAKGISVIGDKFRKYEIFLPEVMIAADAMKAGVNILKPHITAERVKEIVVGKAVIGTAFGDIHDIGKNLVSVMLSVNGFEVHDMGTDVASTKFIEKAKEVGADIIAISSLMATSMYYQKDTIQYLKDMNSNDTYWVIVGGGPVTSDWAVEIGADGYGRYSSDAVEVAKILMDKGKEVERPVIKE